MQRLIDAEHLKERIMKLKSGSWIDIYTMIAYIDTEPTAKSDSISQEIVKDQSSVKQVLDKMN